MGRVFVEGMPTDTASRLAKVMHQDMRDFYGDEFQGFGGMHWQALLREEETRFERVWIYEEGTKRRPIDVEAVAADEDFQEDELLKCPDCDQSFLTEPQLRCRQILQPTPPVPI